MSCILEELRKHIFREDGFQTLKKLWCFYGNLSISGLIFVAGLSNEAKIWNNELQYFASASKCIFCFISNRYQNINHVQHVGKSKLDTDVSDYTRVYISQREWTGDNGGRTIFSAAEIIPGELWFEW